MNEGAAVTPAGLEADRGLDLLFPLYSLLRSTGREAVCRLLITSFTDAQYVKENIGKCVKSDMSLYNFLCHINQTLKKNRERENNSKKCKTKKSPSSQATCSNQQQQYRQTSHQQGHQLHSRGCASKSVQCSPPQYICQPQAAAAAAAAKGQHPAHCSDGRQNKWPLEIQNVTEKERILIKLTVGNLLQRDKEAYAVLLELDLNFILSIILHELISFKLDDKMKNALCTLKKVRKTLVHAKHTFTEEDFDDNLSRLKDALGVIHEALHLPDQALLDQVKLCQAEAMSGNKIYDILHDLRSEAHTKYSSPDPAFVSPNITFSQMHRQELVEDVQKFIEDRSDNLDPILLCGEHKEERTLVFEKLAFKAKSCQKYKLVLYIKDRHRKSCCHQVTSVKDTEKAAREFQNQLFACLTNLVPDTFHKYGLDAIKTAVKIYQKYILFLINWNVSVLGPVQSEMQHGTWIMACNAKEPPQGGWQVLRLEPYTDLQVREMLSRLPNPEDLLRCYNSFNSRHILSSLDMIQIFCELSETIYSGTDFEVMNAYVSQMVRCAGSEIGRGEQDLLSLGKLAFYALFCKRFTLLEKDIIDIQECVSHSFLIVIEGEGWTFKHSVVRDFLAAKYVVSESSVACKNWVKKDEKVVSFMRVFKFACFMWSDKSKIEKEILMYIETFLRTLLHAPDKRAQHSERKERSGDKNSNLRKKKNAQKYENKQRNPFDNWDLLLDLDSVCTRKILRPIVSVLSDIPCWRFDVCCLDATKLTRLGKMLKKVTLDKKDPVIIKLKSNANVVVLIELWRTLRGIDTLYDRVDLMLTINGDDADHLNYRHKLEEFLERIADTHLPLYISRYKGPLFSSSIPSFFKCMCMHHLKILEVSVYDVESLREVMMACKALQSLQEVFIKVNLELTEQISFKPAHSVIPIKFPDEISVHITFKYFPQIQQLLDIFERRDHLSSLSIHGLYIFEDFKLNLSKFSNLKSLNIRYEPQFSGEGSEVVEKDRMEVDDTNILPRCHWMLPLLNGLSLPQKIERLLLRNVEFINDSCQNFIIQLLEKYNINRLLILDTQLSLTGVRQLLHSQTEAKDDVAYDRERKLRRHESRDIRKLAERRTRLSKEEREAMKWNKPDGKEVVITSEGLLCTDCYCFPCMCPSKVDHTEGCNSFERMVEVISDMYSSNIQTFSYSFNQCTIRKDMCGDLRVHCIMKCLNDSTVLEMDSRSCVMRFFLPLMLAQSVTLQETALSPVGVAKVAEHLKHIRDDGNRVDPFSLTIETRWHPVESTSFRGIKGFLETAKYLSVIHFRCVCTRKCFHIKKTYRGKIEDLIEAQSGC